MTLKLRNGRGKGSRGMGACAAGDLWDVDCDGTVCPDDPGCPSGTYASVDVNGCAVMPCMGAVAVAATATTVAAQVDPLIAADAALAAATVTDSTSTSASYSGVAALGLVALFAIVMMAEG